MQSSRLLPKGAKAMLARTPKHKNQRTFIAPAYNLAKRIMPKISDTERAALQAGTIKFDRDLFVGDPTVKHLTETYKPAVATPEEQKFLDNEVNTLCEMVKTYDVMRDANLSPDTWKYIRQNKFMGLMIKKNFGGMGFTGHGHAKIVEKISGRDSTACVTVMVPNSLGPGELLAHYGTQAQKDFYLPRLANGIDIPCFGLTGPSSGSDAASMRDEGIVVMKDGKLGINISCNKRYITLAPVATVVGLAFKLKDPNGLLTKGKEGITVALLPTQPNQFAPNGIPGLQTGPRHDPFGSPFMNGTVKGDNFFVPIECIIGGEENAGLGWNMLMECLGEGRGISLPAGALAASKMAVLAVGGYARVRKQFKVPIATMQGVQEKLSVIAINTFTMMAAQNMFNSFLANGEKPSCLSAVMKQACTERGRISINEGMDVMGGAAICNGPSNFMAGGYGSVPVSITVEGANVLTRSLIVFGQGLTRSHPHLLNLIAAIEHGDDLAGFNKELTNIIKHAFTNLGRSVTRGLSAQVTFRGSDIGAYHEAHMSRLAANFAYMADCGLTMGGGIKTAEFVSGRYADVLTNLYLGYSVMWFYQNNKEVQGLDKVFDMTMTKIRYDIQEAMFGIFANFPIPGMGFLMQLPTFPRGREFHPPTDKQRAAVSDLITTPNAVRDFLTENTFVSKDPQDRVNMITRAASACFEADKILAACRKEGKRAPTAEEQKKIDAAEAMREEIIQVDSFPKLMNNEHNESWMKPTWGVDAKPTLKVEPAESKKQATSA